LLSFKPETTNGVSKANIIEKNLSYLSLNLQK